jgi:hypothetical protein
LEKTVKTWMIKNGLGTNAGGAKVVAPFLFYGLD